MSTENQLTNGEVTLGSPTIYSIRIQGHLDGCWAEWFAPLTLHHEPEGQTTLTGPVADQAALHGLLRKVRDLGLPLIAVSCESTSSASSREGSVS